MMATKKTAGSVLGIALTLALALSGCSGNANTPSPAGGKAPDNGPTGAEGEAAINLDEKYEITMFQWGPRDIAEDDAIIAYINDKFNIDFKVERILAKEYVTNLELKIAAGDMPDIFRYPLGSMHIYNHLYEDGYLMNFEEYAERYDLDGLRQYMNREGTEEFREADGVYQLPSNRGKEATLLIVRQDWLDELGLAHPKTWAEFEAMLQAFKDNQLGGASTVPLTAAFGVSEFFSITPSFTGANTWAQTADGWIYEPVMPEYKEYYRYLAELYQKGLVDRELFTANETQAKAKFVSGASGLYMAGANRYNEVERDLLAGNPDAELAVILPKPEGPAGALTRVSSAYVEPVVAIRQDRDEDFLARVAALLDFMHSEEGIRILNFGIEDVHYNLQDGKMVKTEAYERDILPSLGHLTAMTTDYSAAAGNVEGVLKENIDYSAESGLAPPLTQISYGSATELIPAIEQKTEEWMIAFVTGKKDVDADWDAYISEMNAAGVTQLIAAVEENTKDWQ
ncbi:extracellular solute-binding protein [Paenibacillus sp. IB182496]|uniref:Extracellular solute-binding protein n=1 Tax=Paenibacillus sabuli TaxID=2772509 RepID=A0A927GRS4_9BACL|nr:extracellular solute-binding protein [Paenibacillus sabuli]MBD2845566.1 extracellular solute-binding protein [Paenibacillus sabuli]